MWLHGERLSGCKDRKEVATVEGKGGGGLIVACGCCSGKQLKMPMVGLLGWL